MPDVGGQLVTRFIEALEAAVAAVDPSTTPSPPGSSAEGAGKGLRKLCEAPAEHDGLAGATKALCASPHIARVLCATVATCTAAIDSIDADKQLDLAASGLVAWGHLRANALAVLLHMASSEERCRELLDATEQLAGTVEQWKPGGHIAATCAAVLSSAASRTDLEGVRIAATLLRNLAMPLASRTRLTAAADVLGVLRAHVAHRDPNTAAVVAAALRLLVEGAPSNAALLAASSPEPFAPLLALELTQLHPHARAELARFVCLTITGAWAAATASGPEGGPAAAQLAALSALVTRPALDFGCFLLASRHPGLHREACAALRAARAIWRARVEGGESGEGGEGGGASPTEGVTVVGQPLAGVLQGLLQAGQSLKPAECEGLL